MILIINFFICFSHECTSITDILSELKYDFPSASLSIYKMPMFCNTLSRIHDTDDDSLTEMYYVISLGCKLFSHMLFFMLRIRILYAHVIIRAVSGHINFD